MIKTAIGQDSHRFEFENKHKKLILGGVVFENEPPLNGNSDADVVLHSVTNAVSGITGVNIIGEVADKMCAAGEPDSRVYLKKALEYLKGYKINHVSVSIECKRPKITPKIEEMRESIAGILGIEKGDVGVTATSGEGLTEFGKGNGVQVLSIVTVEGK